MDDGIKRTRKENPKQKALILSIITLLLEMKSIRTSSYIYGLLISSSIFSVRIALFATILSYATFGNSIQGEIIFVVYAFFNVLRSSMTSFFPQAMSIVAEGNVSIERINDFLLLEEIKKSDETNQFSKERFRKICSEKPLSAYMKNGNIIKLTNASAKWNELSIENALTDISIEAKSGDHLIVIGAVGSGKSSLIQVILKELPITSGKLKIDGEISYASQIPWLFAGTIQQNIIFGLPLDEERYRGVIEICALLPDLELFTRGDQTIVGERGMALSGGQQARINLARAIYRQADIYLLDDPLSAVDSNVGRYLFEKLIVEYLKDKIVVLNTHQLQYLNGANRIVYLEDGRIKAEGSYEEIINMDLDYIQSVNQNTNEDVIKDTDNKNISKIQVNDKNLFGSTNSLDRYVEERQVGRVGIKIYAGYCKAAGYCGVFCMLILFILAQTVAALSDYFLVFWIDWEETSKNSVSNEFIYYSNDNSDVTYYDFVPLNQTSPKEAKQNLSDLSTTTMYSIYASLIGSLILISMLRSTLYFYVCTKAASKLHKNMFNNVSKATMRFFTLNSTGSILNRFSNDIGVVDSLLPHVIMEMLQYLTMSIGIVALVAVADVWLLLPTLVLAALALLFRRIYVATGGEVKRLERVTHSPVLAHVNASLQGHTIIRAYNAEAILQQEFGEYLDLHSSAWYTHLVTFSTLGVWIDFLCVAYTTLILLRFLTSGDQSLGNVGLAITQCITLVNIFQWSIVETVEMESEITSVERILEYNSIDHELNPKQPIPLPPSWPQNGHIEFKNVYLSYYADKPPVLQDITFTIYPKEKIGIVGRTGAGKSSIMNALLCLTETEGSVVIDHINIKDINLQELRSRISVISQEAILLSGTLRKNLDPFSKFDDEKLWEVLREVGMSEKVQDLQGNLDHEILESGTNLSLGQKQLIGLARAILDRNKILFLDEASASIDPRTDIFIQKTIRNKFIDCTVVTVAHRLNTIIDSDKVMVMAAGRIKEFDHPYKLMQDKFGEFHGIVQQTGEQMATSLFKIAEDNYKKI